MPASATRRTLARQWALLRDILPPRQPGKTARELTDALNASGFKVSKRQIERDLNDLQELFPIECNDDEFAHRWYWAEGSGVSLPGLSLSEALSLTLLEKTLRPLLPQSMLETLDTRFDAAKRTLSSVANDFPKARWHEKIATAPASLPLLPPATPQAITAVVQEALFSNLQLEMMYQGRDEMEPSSRVVHPLGLVQQGSRTYLVALREPDLNIRKYSLHRIKNAKTINVPVGRPKNFKLEEHIASGAFQHGLLESIKLHAWVSVNLGVILKETPLSQDQRLSPEKNEGYTLEATVTDSWQLRMWILSQGDFIRVDKPVKLKRDIAHSLKTAFEQYL